MPSLLPSSPRVHALAEAVDCGAGRKDKATVDRVDKVRGCEKVSRPRR
jgi:hypothetical protein